ncbi:MAG: ABC transporter substrate-binding protein [Longimicrobiales bacterium]
MTGCGDRTTESRPDTLVAAIESDPGQLNPAITTSGGVHTVADLLYNGLVGLDEHQRPVPELARSWTVDEDGRLYRFHLQTGVRWHDGRPFTAADVVYSFNEVLLNFHARTRASLRAVLLSVDAVDDSTVEFHFRQPYSPFLQQLNVVEAPILPRHLYAGRDPQTSRHNIAPVGTGPFRFVSYAPDAEIRYARNPNYFGGPPAIAAVIFRVIPDPTAQVLALEAGQVDWLFGVPAAQQKRLRGNPRVRMRQTTIGSGGTNCMVTLAFNLDRAAFTDVRIRRAIAHAIDRNAILERIQFGSGRVPLAPISSRIPLATAPGLQLPVYDTALSARLLEQAGWPRGQVLDLKLLPSFRAYAELIRAQLRAVGIDARLQLLEQAVFVHDVFDRRDFDMAMISYCNGTDPQIGVRRQYVSSSIGAVPFSNAAGYRNAEMDSLFDVAGRLVEPADRQRTYLHIQQLAVRDLPYIWLLESEATQAHLVRCAGFAFGAHFAATARCR